MLTGTHSFQLQQNFWRQAAYMKHYWGLNCLTVQYWTSSYGKLCILWVQRFKQFYSLFQNTDSILNVISIFVTNGFEMRSLVRATTHTHAHAHTHTHTHTHTHKHSRNSPSQRPITTQNTRKPTSMPSATFQTPVTTIEQPNTARPWDRRLFMCCVLNSFFLKTLNSFVVIQSFKRCILNGSLLRFYFD